MRRLGSNSASRIRSLHGGASLLVLSALAVTAAPSLASAQAASATTGATPQAATATAMAAQTGDAPVQTNTGNDISSSTTSNTNGKPDASDAGDLVVIGVRQSLKTSEALKRDSDTIMDSITATDIGAFPDKSVAEALQRVAGITVNRFAASDDTSHFSAEPSGVIVRGLPQVRSEFNGRDQFDANSSRGLSWGDVSPELMSGVDVYKNQTAELIEGGIAGSINLRTRVPFDSPGTIYAATVDATYGDLRGKVTPDASALISKRWQTEYGEFGLLGDFAYSKVENESQGIQYTRMGAWVGYDGTSGNAGDPNYGVPVAWIPSAVLDRDTLYDRTRIGYSIAGQWQDNDHKFLVTGQFNRSQYTNIWQEHAVGSYPADQFYGLCAKCGYGPGNANAPQAAPGTPPLTFDENGIFTSGTMLTDIGWWGSSDASSAGYATNGAGQMVVNPCYDWNGCAGPSERAPDFNAETRYNKNQEMTEDGSLNIKWNPSDRLHFNFDVQRVHSTVHNLDDNAELYSYANVGIDATGSHPILTISDDPTNINWATGGLQNPENYYVHDAMDHIEDSSGGEWAGRLDMQYDIKSTWLDSLKVGVRWSDRDQTVRWSAYNWANVTNNWTCNQAVYWAITQTNPADTGSYPGCGAATQHFNGYSNFYTPWSLPNGFFGGNQINQNQFIFTQMDILKSHDAMAAAFGAPSLGVGSWDPLCSNTGARASEIPGTCFEQGEIDQVDERTEAAYAELKFGGPDARLGNFGISGNIGVRYVVTKDHSVGGVNYPSPLTYDPRNCGPNDAGPPDPNKTPGTLECYISADEYAFNSGGGTLSDAKATHKNILPSFNLKVNLTDKWVFRVAVSRAMSRPDMGLLKNSLNIGGANFPSTGNISDPRWIKDSSGNVTGVVPYYTATAYNPYLKPETADQIDLSLENYFSSVGYFSITGFYKKFHDYIQFGEFGVDVTNNGVTREVTVSGPANTKGGSVEGFEIAYQRFFDFLPKPLDGLGIQANFTVVHAHGVDNSGLHIVNQPGTTSAGVPDSIKVNSLEGMSKYSYNIIGMYEKGHWAARVAYNWRSKYLVTALDCCVYLPVWSRAQGFLDASLRYRINDHFEVNVEGSNLLNTKTVLVQQVTDWDQGGLLAPNAWFQNDRRIQAGIRLKY